MLHWFTHRVPSDCNLLHWLTQRVPSDCNLLHWFTQCVPSNCNLLHWLTQRVPSGCNLLHWFTQRVPSNCNLLHWFTRFPSDCNLLHWFIQSCSLGVQFVTSIYTACWIANRSLNLHNLLNCKSFPQFTQLVELQIVSSIYTCFLTWIYYLCKSKRGIATWQSERLRFESGVNQGNKLHSERTSFVNRGN